MATRAFESLLCDELEVGQIPEFVLKEVAVSIPVAAPAKQNALFEGDALKDPGEIDEPLPVLPVDGVRRHVHGKARLMVVLARGPGRFALALGHGLILGILAPVAVAHGEIDDLDRLAQNALQIRMTAGKLIEG